MPEESYRQSILHGFGVNPVVIPGDSMVPICPSPNQALTLLLDSTGGGGGGSQGWYRWHGGGKVHANRGFYGAAEAAVQLALHSCGTLGCGGWVGPNERGLV